MAKYYSAADIHRETAVYDLECYELKDLSYERKGFRNWGRSFKGGRTSMHDEYCPLRLVTPFIVKHCCSTYNVAAIGSEDNLFTV